MEKEENEKILYTISFTKTEYDYLLDVITTLYDNLSKLPKKMRTPKFYVLENMLETRFKHLFSE